MGSDGDNIGFNFCHRYFRGFDRDGGHDAFSSLQKTYSGANQPLGIVLGIVPILPSLLLPLVLPSLATLLELAIAGITILISLGLLLSAGRLILREKLLP